MPSKTLAQKINLEASQKLIPLSVFIELTRRCNLTCYYCYQKNFKPSPELDTQTWDAVFGQLADMGTLNIAFSGGEPFLRNDFPAILQNCRKRDFAVSIISNGCLLSDEMAAALDNMGIMDVGISLHAANAALHDTLSGTPGSFQSALGAIRSLVRHNVKVLIKHSVSNANFGEYSLLQTLAETEGCGFECDPGILPAAQNSLSPFAPSADQLRAFFTDMGIAAPLTCAATREESALHCDAGRSLCGITPDGDVYPCIILPVSLGNITRQSFRDIWHGEQATQFRADENNLDADCVSCELQHACSRCHAVAWLESGHWKGKSRSLCERAQAMISLNGFFASGAPKGA